MRYVIGYLLVGGLSVGFLLGKTKPEHISRNSHVILFCSIIWPITAVILLGVHIAEATKDKKQGE